MEVLVSKSIIEDVCRYCEDKAVWDKLAGYGDFYYKLKTNLGIRALTDKGVEDNAVTSVAYVLRMLKFFNEKAGERE
jgi:hypothetical protein